jgi:hypothetical protein
MMNQMGIKVNLNEAQVLVASADKDRNQLLNMNEFIDLIFSPNDAFDVDLGTLRDAAQDDNE